MVRRHWFLPTQPSRRSTGTGRSSPIEVRAGQQVLEIGTGTGYNAALLAQLVGPEGRVTTVDVDLGSARRRNVRHLVITAVPAGEQVDSGSALAVLARPDFSFLVSASRPACWRRAGVRAPLGPEMAEVPLDVAHSYCRTFPCL